MSKPRKTPNANRKKEGLKRQFGLWAIRREDITMALHAWQAFRKAAKEDPKNGPRALLSLTGFVASYGRVFSGDSAHQGLPLDPGNSDTALHEHLMELRHQAVAHSDFEYRGIRLIPPGAICQGFPVVPAHQTDRWRWLIQALELHADQDHVEKWLKTLQKLFEDRSDEALKRLLAECSDQIIPSTEITLEEL
mgnify:FL=1|tara:strand:+ start:7178 stop:7756 length:579 start_codon:yes stop_codon:yes gene_type:complete